MTIVQTEVWPDLFVPFLVFFQTYFVRLICCDFMIGLPVRTDRTVLRITVCWVRVSTLLPGHLRNFSAKKITWPDFGTAIWPFLLNTLGTALIKLYWSTYALSDDLEKSEPLARIWDFSKNVVPVVFIQFDLKFIQFCYNLVIWAYFIIIVLFHTAVTPATPGIIIFIFLNFQTPENLPETCRKLKYTSKTPHQICIFNRCT